MKGYRIVSALLLIVLLFGFAAVCYATGEDTQVAIAVSAQTYQVQAGEEVTFTVELEKNTGFAHMVLDIGYDPLAMCYVSHSFEGGLSEAACAADVSAEGSVAVNIDAAEGETLQEIGQLMTVTFRIAEAFEGTTSVSAMPQSLLDAQGQAITAYVGGGCDVECAAEQHVHTEEVIPFVAPTCTEPGWTEGIQCAECGEILEAPQYIAPNGHKPGEPVPENLIPASCQSDGSYESVVYCTICSEELSRETVAIPSNGEHNYAYEQERVEATCTETGYVIMACACGETQQTILELAKHTAVSDAGVEPTCTEPGLSEGSHCAVCGYVIAAQEELPALGHTEVVLDGWAATCTEPGLTDGLYCTTCGVTTKVQEQTPLAQHEEQVLPGVAATCTEPGKTAGTVCAVCDAVLVAQTDIPATGHTEISVSAVAPTCSSTGLTEGTKCASCGITVSGREVVDKLPHTEKILSAAPPTCSTAGKGEGKCCAVCGEILVAQAEIPTLAHTEEIIAAIAPTCSSVGWTEGSRCSVCREILVTPVEVAKTAHSFVDSEPQAPTCTQAGYNSSTSCSVCGELLSVGETIPALGHSYDHDCDTSCNACGEVRTSVQHKFGNWVTTKEATKDADGLRTRRCTLCGFEESRVIAAVADTKNTVLIVGLAFVVMVGCVIAIVLVTRKSRAV